MVLYLCGLPATDIQSLLFRKILATVHGIACKDKLYALDKTGTTEILLY